MGKPDDLETISREYGGLEGLARKVGQGDPLAYRFEPAANDNEPPTVVGALLFLLHRLIAKGRLLLKL